MALEYPQGWRTGQNTHLYSSASLSRKYIIGFSRNDPYPIPSKLSLTAI
jgi:hypothetical protein